MPEAKRHRGGPSSTESPERPVRSSWGVWHWAFVFSLVAYLAHAYYLRGLVEDAFITFRFARHLAASHGIVWNVGESPVEGYTNFLWLLFAAVGFRLDVDVPILMQFAGVVSSIGTLVLVHAFARHVLDVPGRHAWVPPVFLAFSGPFAAWSTSGLESNWFGLLLLAGAYAFCRWVTSQSSPWLASCWLALVAATLTRPEGFLIFGLLVVLGTTVVVSGRTSLAQWVTSLAVYVVPCVGYFIWRTNYFGYLLPNTFYAKTGGGLFQALRGARYASMFGLQYGAPFLLVLVPLCWDGAPDTVDARLAVASLMPNVRARPGAWVCALILGAFAGYVVLVGGDYMAMYRFFVPVLPFRYLLFGLAAHALLERSGAVMLRRLLARALVFAAAVLGLWPSVPVHAAAFEKPSFMHGTLQGVNYERWCVARYAAIGKFFDAYAGPLGRSLAIGPIGVVGYYADIPIHSTYGIVDTHIAHGTVVTEAVGKGFPGHEKQDLLYVLAKKPDFILFAKRLSPAPLPYPEYPGDPRRAEIEALVRSDYVRRWVKLDDLVNGESGLLTFLERKAPGVAEGPLTLVR